MTRLLVTLAIALGLLGLTCQLAAGDAVVAGSDAVASPPMPTGPAAQTPADKLHNPVDEPAAAYDDLKAAKRQGWAAAILAALVMLTAGLARAAQRWSALAFFAKNKHALLVLGGVSTVGAAAFNALLDGGAWTAVLLAAAGTVLSLITPTPKASA